MFPFTASLLVLKVTRTPHRLLMKLSGLWPNSRSGRFLPYHGGVTRHKLSGLGTSCCPGCEPRGGECSVKSLRTPSLQLDPVDLFSTEGSPSRNLPQLSLHGFQRLEFRVKVLRQCFPGFDPWESGDPSLVFLVELEETPDEVQLPLLLETKTGARNRALGVLAGAATEVHGCPEAVQHEESV